MPACGSDRDWRNEKRRCPMWIVPNLLSGVALLVWGAHIVRTGILRVLGAPGALHATRWRKRVLDTLHASR